MAPGRIYTEPGLYRLRNSTWTRSRC